MPLKFPLNFVESLYMKVAFFWPLLLALSLFAAPYQDRFIERGRSLVLDDKSDLLWDRCATGLVFNGVTCSGLAQELDLRSAQKACAGRGFRLPDRAELESLVDLTLQTPPFISLHFFPGTPPARFWSASRYAAESGTWYELIDFGTGLRTAAQTGRFHVRCVRNY
jgi:hypothetical protein